MAYDKQMALRVRQELTASHVGTVQEKPMFGALGFIVNGRLAICVGSTDVMYKLGADYCKELVSKGVAEPVVMGERTMKDWVNIYFYNLEEPSTFKRYLSQSLAFSATKHP
ncbi:MAG TPA: TfoX/Sxy family protein [Candidatus Saccharimonadales bacterium]|nr:TfoX/Sxy family protein [Candidatus Saccharimonadales bacterium]